MRILHLHNDWKWTGPSEPILNLCRGLVKRGHKVWLGCVEPPEDISENMLLQRAWIKGIETVLLKRSGKLGAPLALMTNIRVVRKFLNQPIDVIHTHSALGHYIAARACRKLSSRPFIVRTNHKGSPLEPSWINRRLIKKATDGYVTLAESLLDQDREQFGMPKEKSWWVEGAIDMERLKPDQARIDLRSKYGLASSDVVAGVVARIQKHRRFEVLLEAVVEAIKTVPELKVLVLGRGTHQQKILAGPVEKLGLTKQVIRAGYVRDEYADALKLMDFGIYLRPGSDGSCRAAREMMALGKPIVVLNYGILPELVRDGKDGLVLEPSPKALAEAMIKLAKNKSLRAGMGQSAKDRALRHFQLDQQAEKIETIYGSLRV